MVLSVLLGFGVLKSAWITFVDPIFIPFFCTLQVATAAAFAGERVHGRKILGSLARVQKQTASSPGMFWVIFIWAYVTCKIYANCPFCSSFTWAYETNIELFEHQQPVTWSATKSHAAKTQRSVPHSGVRALGINGHWLLTATSSPHWPKKI